MSAEGSVEGRLNLMSNELPIDKIFGLHRGDTLQYIDRDEVDLEFIRHIASEKHICIYGCSKQGKTALRKKHLSEREYLLVTCDNTWTINNLHSAILRTAGCIIVTKAAVSEKTSKQVDMGIAAKVKLPLISDFTGKLGGKGTIEKQASVESQEIPIDLGDVGQLSQILDDTFDGNIIVIEEFHYLPEETQKTFAHKLKTWHELTKYIFVIVGVWLEDNRLTA